MMKKESQYLQVGKLPILEARLCVITWCGFAALCCYSVYTASQDYVSAAYNRRLATGWIFAGSKRDASNAEWEFMRGWIGMMWRWFIVYILLSLFLSQVAFKHRFYILSLYGVAILVSLVGYKPVLLLVVECVVMYLTSTYFRSAVAVWTVSSGFLCLLNVDSFNRYLETWARSGGNVTVQYFLLIYALSMTNIRYTSFCLEHCHHLRSSEAKGRQGKGQGFSFLDMFVYIFYFPVFFSGPLMTYDQFYLQSNQPKQPWTKPKVMKIIKDVVRISFWALFIEVILHYFYFNSMMHDWALLRRLPRWALMGVGYCHGQFFMVKYLVIFGIPAVLTQFDHIKSAERPKCISRIYLYSEMWKNFDVGLYNFITRHIYIPLGGSRHGFMRQMLASVISFVFIFLWHGAEFYLFIWTSMNYLGILLESVAANVSSIPSVKAFERRWLSPANSRRLRALATVPSFAMSILAIFIFFGGAEVGPIYIERLLYYAPALPWMVALLYTYIQSSIETSVYEAEKVKQN